MDRNSSRALPALQPTTAAHLFQAENRLFTAWQRRRPDLLRDGALGGPASRYLDQPVRVLFALKEPNDTGGRWSQAGADLRLQTHAFAGLRSTFPVLLLLARLAQSIQTSPTLDLPFDTAQEQLRDPAAREDLLRSVALVNIKKTPGGPVCDDRALATAIREDGDLLLRQLALYRPHLTIAGGHSVHALLAELTGHTVAHPAGELLRPSFIDSRLGLCLSFFHPQATKGYRYLYDLLRHNLRAQGFPASLQTSKIERVPTS